MKKLSELGEKESEGRNSCNIVLVWRPTLKWQTAAVGAIQQRSWNDKKGGGGKRADLRASGRPEIRKGVELKKDKCQCNLAGLEEAGRTGVGNRKSVEKRWEEGVVGLGKKTRPLELFKKRLLRGWGGGGWDCHSTIHGGGGDLVKAVVTRICDWG